MIYMAYDGMRQGSLIALGGTQLFIADGSPIMGSRAMTKLLDLSSDGITGCKTVPTTSESLACFNEIKIMLDHPTVNPEVVEALFDVTMCRSKIRTIAERSVMA